MKIINTTFKDLLIIKQKNNIDKRGSLREIYNKKFLKKHFIFEYCTTSKANALRGFHFQYKFQQAKYVSVLKGKILDCVVDLRKNSKTFGKYISLIISDKSDFSFYAIHGFVWLEIEQQTLVTLSSLCILRLPLLWHHHHQGLRK